MINSEVGLFRGFSSTLSSPGEGFLGDDYRIDSHVKLYDPKDIRIVRPAAGYSIPVSSEKSMFVCS